MSGVTFSASVEPCETACRGISRHAGVDHFVLEPFLIQTLLQQCGIRLVRRQAQTGGKAVAKDHDARSRRDQVRLTIVACDCRRG